MLASSSLNISVRFNNSRASEQSDIMVNNEFLSYSYQSDTLEINGRTYTQVMVFVNAGQVPSQSFEKIILSKTIGIIAIIERDGAWEIKDNSARHIEISDIEFKSTDC